MVTCKHMESISAKLLPLWDVAARLMIANIFWKSGLSKIDNWGATIWLFKKEYGMTFMPTFFAYLATGIELITPVMLVLGLGTRLAGLALFGLSIVIHMTYPTFSEHYFWMLLCASFALRGASCLSLDRLIAKRLGC